MKQYFLLQCKRIGRFLPGVLLASAILLGSLGCLLQLLVNQERQQEENQKFKIGIVGSAEDPLLQMGLSALSYYDSSRFSMELVELTETEAGQALSAGRISAYVVIPENFVEEAYYGNILPLKFVSTVGATGMIAIFQAEITDTVSQILLDAQKGVYGMAYAAENNGVALENQMEQMPIEYTQYVFLRDKTYTLTDLGIGDGLGFAPYLLCGFLVVFLLLCCLSFAPLMIRKDDALSCMLASRKMALWKQNLCDFGAFSLAMVCVAVILLGLLCLIAPAQVLALLTAGNLLRLLAVILSLTALSYFLYCLSTDLVGGILLQFFTTLTLGFVSGCLYPAWFFPAGVQAVAALLPTGAVRSVLAGCVTGETAWGGVFLALGYGAVFFLAGSFVRCRKVKEVEL